MWTGVALCPGGVGTSVPYPRRRMVALGFTSDQNNAVTLRRDLTERDS